MLLHFDGKTDFDATKTTISGNEGRKMQNLSLRVKSPVQHINQEFSHGLLWIVICLRQTGDPESSSRRTLISIIDMADQLSRLARVAARQGDRARSNGLLACRTNILAEISKLSESADAVGVLAQGETAPARVIETDAKPAGVAALG